MIDDHPLTREGIGLAVRAATSGGTVVSVGTIEEAEARLAKGRFALVLMDFQMPGVNGFTGFLRIQHASPDTSIAIVSSHERPSLVNAARALGAAGYLFKSEPLDSIADRIAAILSGACVFPDGSAQDRSILNLRERIETLSRSQLNVLLALADGQANKQIAHHLSITEATVKAHMSAIFRKLGVTNRTQALIAVRSLLGSREAKEE